MPSGATANAATPPVWPVRVWRACPVCGSQIRTVASCAGGGQPGAVRGDRQRRHPAGVAGEGVAGLPGVRVPDPHRPSSCAGGGQPGAVRGDRQRRHPAGVAGEGVAGLPGVRVPDPHRRRRRPAEASQVPSGATANAVTPPVWPVRVWRACPVCGSQIRTVVVVAGGGQPGAVRGDRQRRHPAGVAGEGVAGLPGVRVPDPHRRRRRRRRPARCRPGRPPTPPPRRCGR